MKLFKKSIFLFHRDLRLHDNTALQQCVEQSDEILPVFIIDPKQADEVQNPYFNANFFSLLMASLHDLSKTIAAHNRTLIVLKGNTLECLQTLYQEYVPDAFFSNLDYTPFAENRDKAIAALNNSKGITSCFFHDACLQPPKSVVKKDGTPYTVFTPFYKACLQRSVPAVLPAIAFFPWSSFVPSGLADIPKTLPPKILATREHALFLLKTIDAEYAQNRDFAWSEKNTKISPYLKTGQISIREAFWAFFLKHGEASQGICELYWRDFFMHITAFFPHVLQGKSFHQKYDALKWKNNFTHFTAWCDGKTGFPMVDAGMRELKETGLMHNRLRMVTASFLIKNLHIDWRWGEKYFAQHLLDYDPAVNNGNWQWAASTGCDAAPYFRVFSPISQHQRFDSDSIYVKKWIPELIPYTTKQMLDIETSPLFGYCTPLVSSKTSASYAKEMFKECI